MLFIKKSFVVKSSLQRLKLSLERALTLHLHLPHYQLILPARLIHADFTMHLHLSTFREPHATPAGRSAKHHAGDLGACILQGEVLVPAGLQPVIADLSLDADIVNRGGGALSRGHPIGASGAILAVRLFHELAREASGAAGLAAIAAMGGLGSALLLERV